MIAKKFFFRVAFRVLGVAFVFRSYYHELRRVELAFNPISSATEKTDTLHGAKNSFISQKQKHEISLFDWPMLLNNLKFLITFINKNEMMEPQN